jgi:hypothetical protein
VRVTLEGDDFHWNNDNIMKLIPVMAGMAKGAIDGHEHFGTKDDFTSNEWNDLKQMATPEYWEKRFSEIQQNEVGHFGKGVWETGGFTRPESQMLKDAGMTEYGSTNPAEFVAEAYIMAVNPKIANSDTPPLASQLMAQQFPRWSNSIVSKGGQGSGRYPKGSEWTTVGGITPEVAEFLTTNANKFYKAGGTIVKVKSGATKLPNGKPLDEARKEIHAKAMELANVKKLTPERQRLVEGYRMMRRNLAMLNKENNREAYVALDKDGNIAGVMGAIQHRTGRDWKITELGSTNEIPGTATALEHYIATVAGNTNLESVATADAQDYHRSIGRTIGDAIRHPFDKTPTGDFTSQWTLEEMRAIAQLPIGPKHL